MKTEISVIGKPNENRFNVGAEREMMPTVTLIISSTMAIGNMMIAADRNIDPAAPIPAAIITSAATGEPTGRMR